MELSQNGLDLIKSFEGCRLTAYRDIVGVLTIGYGHTKNVYAGQTITQAQAERLLMEDCQKFVNHVNTYQSRYNWNQNQFDALVSFAFNIGNINQLTANGTRDNAAISNKILEYCKAGGKTVSGLLTRRKKEQALFISSATLQDVSVSSKNPYLEPKIVLSEGSKGDNVKWLQWELKQYGYNLTIDGIFGTKTLMFVEAFQQKNSLVVDGKVGQKTIGKLLEN